MDRDSNSTAKEYCQHLTVKPIGYVSTWMVQKNSAPFQPSVSGLTRGKLVLDKDSCGYTNPEHALEGLRDFSHIWMIFVFHLHEPYTKAKVQPPHLDGKKVGVFACRSPHRLNPIGLTLTKLDEIRGHTLHLSGVDVVDGTPVVDIKPYIPHHDAPCSGGHTTTPLPVRVSDWVGQAAHTPLTVHITERAEQQLHSFTPNHEDEKYRLRYLTSVEEVRRAAGELLSADPRSVYRRQQCHDRLYYYVIDSVELTCWFDDDENRVEIVKIKPAADFINNSREN